MKYKIIPQLDGQFEKTGLLYGYIEHQLALELDEHFQKWFSDQLSLA